MSQSKDVDKQQVLYSDDALRNVRSFDDALALIEQSGVTPVSVTDYGTGFDVIDKSSLVDTRFVVLEYKFVNGDYGDEFVVAHVVTKNGDKGIITDGGTGIKEQMKRLSAQGAFNGIVCDRGLARSDYEYVDSDGTRRPATTFYLAGM